MSFRRRIGLPVAMVFRRTWPSSSVLRRNQSHENRAGTAIAHPIFVESMSALEGDPKGVNAERLVESKVVVHIFLHQVPHFRSTEQVPRHRSEDVAVGDVEVRNPLGSKERLNRLHRRCRCDVPLVAELAVRSPPTSTYKIKVTRSLIAMSWTAA